MAIDISGLREYVQMNPELLTTFLYEELTVKRVRTYDVSGITPGRFSARIFDPVASLQECCKKPDGTSNIIERFSEAICIIDGQQYCETDIAQILRDGAQVFTAGNESMPSSVEGVITDGQISAFVEALDILTFQGDKSLSDPNLNKLDGLLKIAENEGVVIPSQATDPYNYIRLLMRKIPATLRKMGQIAVFCDEAFVEAYFDVAVGMNLYHYAPGTYSIGAERPVLGKDGIVFIPTRAMSGSNKVLITPVRNIVWFNSRENDHNTLSWGYDEVNQFYYWRIKTIIGVNFVIPEWALISSYDENLLNETPTINVSIVNPMGANGGILTDTNPIAATGVTVSPATAQIVVGDTVQLIPTVQPANATNKAVTWASGSTGVATVDANGLVTGVAAGTATITVTTVDGSHTATSTITVAATRMAPLSANYSQEFNTKEESEVTTATDSQLAKPASKPKASKPKASAVEPQGETEGKTEDGADGGVLDMLNEINK